MPDGYAIKSGHVTEAVLDADTNALLDNWQSLVIAGDVTAISSAWYVKSLNGIEYGTLRIENFSGVIREIGDLVISPWRLNLSLDMLDYLNTTIFAGGTAPSALATIKTYNQPYGVWDAYQVTVERPRYIDGSEGFDPVNNIYYRDYLLVFRRGQVAPAS